VGTGRRKAAVGLRSARQVETAAVSAR
jgi:hypothetical protein